MKAFYLLAVPLLLAFTATADARPHSYKHHYYSPGHHSSHIGVSFGSHHPRVFVSTKFVLSSGNTKIAIGLGNHHHYRPYYGHHYKPYYYGKHRHGPYYGKRHHHHTYITTEVRKPFSPPRYVPGAALFYVKHLPANARAVKRRNHAYFVAEGTWYQYLEDGGYAIVKKPRH